MAELVEYNIEKKINELEQLERYGLLDRDEIKLVIKKRKAFEYRLQRTKRLKEDYLKYIAYEESLLKLIKIRKDKIGFHNNMFHIDREISSNIIALYRKVVFKYQLDVQLWLSYINFCKGLRMLGKVSALFSRMLSVQSHNESVWIMAAKFEFEDNNSPETARNLLQRGIRFNADSRHLWHEYFRMELMFCTKLRKRREILSNTTAKVEGNEDIDEAKDDVYNGKIAEIVYQNSVLKFDDFEFAADFLPICSAFDHSLTYYHKNMIYDDLKLRFSDSEVMWDLMARRFAQDVNELIKSENIVKTEKKLKKKEAERKAIGLYEEMINKFKNEKMWSYYIYYRLDSMAKSHKESIIKDKLAKVLDLIDRAWNNQCLSEELFQEWIKLLMTCKDRNDNKLKIQSILQKGCDRWTDSIDVWKFALSLMIKIIDSKRELKRNFDRILDKFSDRTDISTDKLISIWELYLKWSVKSLLPIEVNSIVMKLTNLSGDTNKRKITEHFKPDLLVALNSVYGIDKARHYYLSYKDCPPLSLSFHQKMIEILNKSSTNDIPFMRSIHENIVNHFGSNYSQLWIEYIKFEMKNNANNIGKIYYKAVKNLMPKECDHFIEQFSILKSDNFND